MKEKKEIHHVFWTGGLDSTYRVIHLLKHTKEFIQPHYVIRHEDSTGNEIDTMNKIIRATWRKNAEWGERLLPTVYTNEDLIPRFKELDADVEELRKTVKVHEQLQILANYCRAFEIEKVDITYERDEVLSPDEVRVAQFFETNPAFKSFRNPHADLTKKGCFEVAKEEGWDDLLKLTSFCRRPKKKGIPCGMCGPCCDAVKEGMGFRLPFVPRMKAKMIIPFRNYYRKNYLKHNKGIFKIAKRKLEHKL